MARANLGFYVTPVGKNSQNMAQQRRIAVAFRRKKFVFTAKIRRIREKFASATYFRPAKSSFLRRKYVAFAKNSQKFASATYFRHFLKNIFL